MCVWFVCVGVGLSNLQHIDLNSSRNLLILGFGLYMVGGSCSPSATVTEAQDLGPCRTA